VQQGVCWKCRPDILSCLQCEHLLQRLEVLKDHLLSVEKFINAELDHRCARQWTVVCACSLGFVTILQLQVTW
jgi:hypothetical protein